MFFQASGVSGQWMPKERRIRPQLWRRWSNQGSATVSSQKVALESARRLADSGAILLRRRPQSRGKKGGSGLRPGMVALHSTL